MSNWTEKEIWKWIENVDLFENSYKLVDLETWDTLSENDLLIESKIKRYEKK